MNFINYQLQQINEGGIFVLVSKLIKIVKIFLIKVCILIDLGINGLWAVPLVLIFRILQPHLKIRFGTIRSDRIGHFVQDAAEQLARTKQNKNTIELFWLSKKICNKQWEKMVKRNLPVFRWVKYLDIWNRIIPGGKKLMRPSSLTRSRDIEGLFEKYDVKMKFLPEEEITAKNWLKKRGWSEDEPYVCVLVRDDKYLANDSLHGKGDKQSYLRWENHNYRNSDISSYVPAMEWLARNGVWVLRMGKMMEKPLQTKHRKIIDYAFNPERNDLLDIWLFANCNLCISTGSGPDFISDIYRKPLLFLNYTPICRMWSWSDALHVPKHLKYKNTMTPLNLKEYLKYNYSSSKDYENAQIEITDLNESEILEATKECWERTQSNTIESIEALNLQDRFWQIFKEWPLFSNYHGWIHKKSGIVIGWLKKNENYFLQT